MQRRSDEEEFGATVNRKKQEGIEGPTELEMINGG